ncbi:hypothetical protein EOG54_21595 [Salmonella enterica]|nr:hypothetical protein [Salmonella enterica]ECE8726416.1 hypothetical protein [Salmonella enterica subsp. enterica serovar Java]EAR4482251.1 hypothetical protein [Salmonella enterica]EAU8491095.1 hypothetical protein [Salmonella enterica]ECS1739632.1 hypothetical protein [Salmonella enterica subsp. enterica serovar Java]
MSNFTLVYTKEIKVISIYAPFTVEKERVNRFVGLPLLIFSIVFIPPFFIGIHYPILILMNLVLLTERSDRDVWRHRSENDLSVIGIIRPAVVSSTPFYVVFSVLYFSGVICSVVTSDSLLAIGGEV